MTSVRPAGTTGSERVASGLLSARLCFEEVHRYVLHLIPVHPARILDVGSGPGHDAATFAARGHAVTAVEPTFELREGARTLYRDLPIEWVDDSLPALQYLAMTCDQLPFDFILVEGVWAHLTEAEPRRSLSGPEPAIGRRRCARDLIAAWPRRAGPDHASGHRD